MSATWETPTHPTIRACNAVIDERGHQDAKWGRQRHDWPVWITVLMEEVGECCQALLAARALAVQGRVEEARTQRRGARAEAVQAAAVLVAMIEHLDEELA